MHNTRARWIRFGLAIAVLAVMACSNDDGTGGVAAAGGGATAGTGGAAGPKATAMITGFMGGTLTGTAAFTQSGTDVTLTVTLNGCVAGKSYPVHIHAGTSCESAMTQGDHWGPQRGEGIPNVMCTGTTGTSMVTRTAAQANLAWSVGGDAATNVVGHAFVAHAPDVPMAPPRIACGVITQ